MAVSTGWKNQIIGYGEEPPESLLAFPQNPKIHPKSQQDALAGSLNELGWIAPVIVNRVTAHVLDGHARIGLAISRGEPLVPIAYVELSPEQEALAVAVYDPIGAMAATDREQLSALLEEVTTGDAALQALLDGLAQDAGIVPTIPEPSEQREPMLASECLIEIRCSRRDLDVFRITLDEWGDRSGVQIDIS